MESIICKGKVNGKWLLLEIMSIEFLYGKPSRQILEPMLPGMEILIT